MARQAVLDILEASLGKYIKDLDVDKLSFSLWRGQINFPRSLKLDADAINREFLYRCDSSGNEGSTGGTVGEPKEVVEDWAMNVNCDRRTKSDYGRRVDKNENNSSSNNLWESLFSKTTTTTTSFSTSTSSSSSPDHPDDLPRYARSSFLKNVRVVSGTVNRLQIDVPWSALASRPIVVRITGIRVVLAPSTTKEERAVPSNEQQQQQYQQYQQHQQHHQHQHQHQHHQPDSSANSCLSGSNVSLSGVSHVSNSTYNHNNNNHNLNNIHNTSWKKTTNVNHPNHPTSSSSRKQHGPSKQYDKNKHFNDDHSNNQFDKTRTGGGDQQPTKPTAPPRKKSVMGNILSSIFRRSSRKRISI